MPVCTKCGCDKPESGFYFQNKSEGKLQKRCKECSKAASKEWAAKNKDKVKKWRDENKDRVKAWRLANADKIKDYSRRAYDQKLAKEGKTRKITRTGDYSKYPNAGDVFARNKHLRTTFYGLSDVAKNACEAVYALRKRLDLETGEPHHVDHIIPICGKNVSGLHVPWNLRVVPSAINRKKHANTFGEEFWSRDDIGDFINELHDRNGFPDDIPDEIWRWPKGR